MAVVHAAARAPAADAAVCDCISASGLSRIFFHSTQLYRFPSTYTVSPTLKMNAASAGGVTTAASNNARNKRFNSDLLFEMIRRASKDARLNYHRLRESSQFQKLYIQPTDTACRVVPVKQADGLPVIGSPLASIQSVEIPWPLAPRS